MDKLILPDTNILILGLAGKEPQAAILREAIENKKLVFSAIVVAEFLAGCTEEEERIAGELFEQFPILPVDLTVAKMAAYYRKKYRKVAKNLRLPDCLIAATAKIYRAKIATLDKTGYPMDDIEILV